MQKTTTEGDTNAQVPRTDQTPRRSQLERDSAESAVNCPPKEQTQHQCANLSGKVDNWGKCFRFQF